MRAGLVPVLGLVLGACTEHGQTPSAPLPDSGVDPMVCEAEFQAALDRTCSVEIDCTLVDHDDCCGVVKLGVAAATASGYPAIEAQLQSCRPCPPLGCNHADMAEDGSVPAMGEVIVATCASNRCTSIVR
jgi:hypothetical protein